MRTQYITDPTFQQRFFARMTRAPSGCLEWQGCKDGCGYGLIRIGGKNHRVHRVAWQIAHGAIPDGLNVLHHCDNPTCSDAINEGHLFLGTAADNAHDRDRKGRDGDLHGEKNGSAKLTETDVLEIRRIYVPGSHEFGQLALARRFRVHQAQIWRVLHREAWQHV